MIAERERIRDVLSCAEHNLHTGTVTDTEALAEAEAQGLVERRYEGALGFMGLSTLYLTEAGRNYGL